MLLLDLKSHEAPRLLALSERTIEHKRLSIRKKMGLRHHETIAEKLKSL